MFREKMRRFTTIVFALSILVGELGFSAPSVAFASNRATKPVDSVPPTTARWVRCNIDGDMVADDWCWVNNARFLRNNGVYRFNGVYYVFRNGRWVLRNRYLLPNGYKIRNGYIMRNGRVIGNLNNLGNPFYYVYP